MAVTFTHGATVFVDTAPFIYFFEDHPVFGPPMARFFDKAYELELSVVTSLVTYMELLTLPEREGDTQLVAQYRRCLTNSPLITLQPIDIHVADAAVRYRARHGFKTPDAIQLASAETCGARWVLTNDRQWVVEGLHIIQVGDLC